MRAAVLFAAASAAVLLWRLDRGVPRPVCRWLERELSKGVVATRFDEASFSLLDGVRIRNARIFIKRRLGPPLLRIDEMRLRGRIRPGRPPSSWIREVTASGLVCRAEDDFPEASGPSGLAARLRHLSAGRDWSSEPVRCVLLDSSVFAVPFRRLELEARVVGASIVADPLVLSVESLGFAERLDGRFSYDAGDGALDGRLAGTLTPEVVRELTLFLDGETAVEYYDRMDGFSAPLQVDASLRWLTAREGRPVSEQDVAASVSGGGFAFNGLPVRHVDLGLRWEKKPGAGGDVVRKMTFEPLRCFLDEGAADAGAVWFPREHKMEFTAGGDLYPSSWLALLDLARPSFLTNIVFASAPSLSARGVVGMGPVREETRVTLEAADAACAAYGIPLRDVRATCSLAGRDDMRVSFGGFSATCYDGKIAGTARLRFPPSADAPEFSVSATLDDVNCGKAKALARASAAAAADSKGRISGELKMSGTAGDGFADTLSGEASARIRDGLLLRFPLFAGLTDFLGRNVPGVDFLLMQSDADLVLSAEKGLATIRRLSLEGNVFSLVASGRCRYNVPGTPVEMVAQLRFFKQKTLIGRLARLMTLPASKLMEFRVTGPAADASWNYIGLVDRILDWTFWPEKDATDVPVRGRGEEKDAAGGHAGEDAGGPAPAPREEATTCP